MKTKLTAGCLSPTIISSQHNITTFLRLHFQEGIREDGERGGGGGKAAFKYLHKMESDLKEGILED